MENQDGYNLINYKLSYLSSFLRTEIIGYDSNIKGFNLVNRNLIGDDYISYVTSEKYLKKALGQLKITALILSPQLYDSLDEIQKKSKSFIISENPESDFYKIFTSIKYPDYDWATSTEDIKVGEGSIIENGVIFGKNVIIGCNSVIKSGTIIGDNVIIGNCSVIGGDGYQLIKDKNGINMTISHRGRTLIGNNVYIGDCSTVSKSLFDGFTEIGDYTKIDNHVHVAHNCKIGTNCVLTASVTLFGSCEIKNNVWIAPNSSVMNRVIVGEGATVGAHSFVALNVKPSMKVFGVPAKKI